jgi:hypothetical protein
VNRKVAAVLSTCAAFFLWTHLVFWAVFDTYQLLPMRFQKLNLNGVALVLTMVFTFKYEFKRILSFESRSSIGYLVAVGAITYALGEVPFQL